VNKLATMTPWKQEADQARYRRMEKQIRGRCEIRFDEELLKNSRRGAGESNCREFCLPALGKQKYCCLCNCGRHREECPVHRL
jgi:hypothetical protein